MLNRLILAFALAFVVSIGATSDAFAFANSKNQGKAAAAPGQAKAIGNCRDVIVKQNGNGQTGSNTGNNQDPKQLNTAVTECDHFWQNIGAIGN